MKLQTFFIIILLSSSILLIPNAGATEYDFENNNLGAWVAYNTGSYYQAYPTVNTASAHNSNYGVYEYYHKNAFDLYSIAGIKTNMTGGNYIDFDYNILGTWSHASLAHNGVEIWTTRQGSYQTLNQGVWQHAHVWIPATAVEETVHIGFGSFEHGLPNAKSGYLDNFESDGFPTYEVPVVSNLTTESQMNGSRLYTNVTIPYFNWDYNSTQNNYMIYVGTTPGASDLWDSGNINTGNTFATYDGWTLNRGVTYYVQVKAYNTEWSAWENGTFKFNQLPVITDISATYDIDEGEYLSIDVDGADPDGDILTFNCNRTDLFTFDTTTGVATWQTDYVDAGTYSVDFGVSDSFENDNQTTIVTITDVTATETPTNDIPVVISACNPIGEASSNDVPVSIQTTVLTGFEKVIDNTFNFFDKIFNLIF